MFKLFRTIFIPAKSNIYSFNICNVMHVYLGKEHKCNPYFVVFQMVCSAFTHSVCLLIIVQQNNLERPLCFFFQFWFSCHRYVVSTDEILNRAVFTWLSKVIEELVWFWFYYALWLASVFTLVLVLRQSSENRSNDLFRFCCRRAFIVKFVHCVLLCSVFLG